MAAFQVKDVDKIIPEAFHGTELSVARKIEAEQKFQPGNSEKLYLGSGAYFYEGSTWLAEDWARKEGPRRGWNAYGVLQAMIQLGRCLDLNIPEHSRELEDWAKGLIEKMEKEGVDDVEEITPAWVLNYFVRVKCQDRIDTIRCSYPDVEHGVLIPDSRIYRNRLVVCVRNMKNISKISLEIRGLII